MTLAPARPRSLSPAVTRAAAYVRVSTDEQAQGHSLGSQREACVGYVERQGWQLVEVFEDAGFSATSTSRPAFQRMLAAAEAGQLDVILVLRFDRFARSLEDWIVTKRALERRGVRLVSVTEPIEDNPMAPILEALHGGLAEWYSRDLSVKVARGLRSRAEKGLMNAMPPFGYRQSADPAHVPPEMVPEEAAAVRAAFEAYATGLVQLVDVAEDLNRRGFRTRYRPRHEGEAAGRLRTSQSVSAMLANPVYAGFVRHKGELLPGAHEAIVSEELFKQAARVRESARGRPAAPVRDAYVLRGIVRCVRCGSNLQGNHTRSGAGYRYYRETARRRGLVCEAPQVALRADRLEAEVDAVVARFTMPADVRERVLELLRAEGGPDDPAIARARLEERLRRIARLFADLAITEGEYDAQRRALEAQLDRLTVPVEQAVTAAETFDVLQAAWQRATPEEKRALALALFEAIYVDTASKAIVDVVVRPAFRPWLSDWRPS